MDKAALLLPVLLSALLPTTFSLSCMECIGVDEKSCKGVVVSCLQDFDVCVATIESDTIDGKETMYRRYCGKTSMCSYSGSLTTNFGVKKIASTCCHTSSCAPPAPKFPTEKTDKNGISCKACNSVLEASCDPSTMVECTGEENKCVSKTIMTKAGPISSTNFASGCGTQGWCSATEREFQSGGMTTEITITCTSGHDALLPALPLMLLAAILIMKVIS